jgi:molybdate transport system substrate-binding protein
MTLTKRWLALLCLAAPAAFAAEITVMSGGAVKTAFTAAAAAWEKSTGNAVKAEFMPAGESRQRIAKGEVADLLVIAAENLPELERAGVLDLSTRRDIASVGMGAAVKAGAPVPDISSPEALKRTLAEAKSVTYMDPARGTSGKHFDEVVLPKLGLRDAVRAKTVFGEGGFIAEKVARGEAEIVFHQLTEMRPVKGVTIVGPLPPELQKLTVYAGVVMKGARHPAEARTLLDYLASPEGRKVFLDLGFQ